MPITPYDASERTRQRKRLPEVLITTPESLSLLLTRENAAELFADLLPKGVFNVVHGRGATIGGRLMNAPQIEAKVLEALGVAVVGLRA